MQRDNADERVQGADVMVKTGWIWKAGQAVYEAESRLRHADIASIITLGRQ